MLLGTSSGREEGRNTARECSWAKGMHRKQHLSSKWGLGKRQARTRIKGVARHVHLYMYPIAIAAFPDIPCVAPSMQREKKFVSAIGVSPFKYSRLAWHLKRGRADVVYGTEQNTQKKHDYEGVI